MSATADAPSRTRSQVVVAHGHETRIEGASPPRPGAGELLLRTRAVGLCGTDLFKLERGVAEPTVLGHEVVGEVLERGAEAPERFAAGSRVVAAHHVPCGRCELCSRGAETMCASFRENLLSPGGFADYLVVRRRAVDEATYLLPEGLADEDAVFLEPLACVLRGIDRSGWTAAGGAIAVLGCGSMGLLHLLALRALRRERASGATAGGDRGEAAPVIAVDPIAERRELAIRLGATHALSPEAIDPRDAACTTVFDTVGGATALATGLDLLAPGGTLVHFAHARGEESAGVAFDFNRWFHREQRLVATYSGSPREQRRAFELLTSGSIRPSVLVTHRLPLTELERGRRLAEEQRALKVLFVPRSAATDGAERAS